MFIPQDLVIAKMVAATALVGGLFSVLIESSTSFGPITQTLLSVLAAGLFSVLLFYLKERSDKKRRAEASLKESSQTDSTSLVAREQLIDGRVNMLINEISEFYSLKDKEKEAINVMYKELGIQKDGMITQQRELISQQAATIVQLQAQLTAI